MRSCHGHRVKLNQLNSAGKKKGRFQFSTSTRKMRVSELPKQDSQTLRNSFLSLYSFASARGMVNTKEERFLDNETHLLHSQKWVSIIALSNDASYIYFSLTTTFAKSPTRARSRHLSKEITCQTPIKRNQLVRQLASSANRPLFRNRTSSGDRSSF